MPQLASSPSSRLVMSFWDREVSLWRVSRGPTSSYESIDGQRHRLVGKVLIQVRKEWAGAESFSDNPSTQSQDNITSATLSPDGKILTVATITDVKMFAVRRRKGDEKGALRVQKLEVPKELSDPGARLVAISPDSRWLCVIRPNSDVYVVRIQAAVSDEKPRVLPQLAKLERATRHARHEKVSHGTLGDYERTIRSVVFSEDSKLLATGDLSGCVDRWVLSTATGSHANGLKSNDVSDSDDESEDEDGVVIEGEHWHLAAPESPIPRMKSGVALLSFRPRVSHSKKFLENGVNGTHHASAGENRLMVLTSEHQLIEFEAMEGKLSDWSRRNPKAYLPTEFRGVKDRAMGCLWDRFEGRERLWLYGTSWLWMFDLLQDFPSPEGEAEAVGTEEAKSSDQLVKASKRKRDQLEEKNERKTPNSGAGDRMPWRQMGLHDTKVRKIVGSDESQGEWISLDKEHPRAPGEEEEAYEYDEGFTASNETSLAHLRREVGTAAENGTLQKHLRDDSRKGRSTSGANGLDDANGVSSQAARRWWHTYKYRDILGIVPLNAVTDDSEDQISSGNLEVAVVERPMWDVELPSRYMKDYE